MPQYFGKLPITAPPWQGVEAVDSVEVGDRHLELTCGPSRVRVSVLAPNLMRVRFAPRGEFLPRRSWAVTLDDDAWDRPAFEVNQGETTIELRTEQVCLEIQRHPCRLQWRDRQGQPFGCDTDLGMGSRLGRVAAWKKIEPDEHFYGFGERTGFLDKRSEIKTNWTVDCVDYGSLTDEMYQAIPVLMALRPGLSYGIFFHSSYWSQFDLGVAQPGTWSMETHSPELDYYLIYGPEPAQILHTYTQLTGRMPLPPQWALGYHQCRWSYDSAAVVRQLAQEFRDRQLPCDVIHLDIDYMRGYRVFTWSPQRFADPQALLHDLSQQGFKTVTIVDPGVKYEPEADYAVFDEGIDKQCFVRDANGTMVHGYVWPDKAVFPDFLKPEVRHWWGHWHHTLTDVGVAGIWNDMNEPSLSDRPFGDEGDKLWFPLDAPQGPPQEGATHAETHNLYGMMMAQAAAEGMADLRPNDRSFVLTRSGFAGIQRWASVWMGDNQSLWEHLELSLPMLCNMGLSGVAFVGCDVGGFAGNATAELFARWMQVGLLYPLMRGHSALTTAQHEPWVFGEEVEAICREYIQLRYRLLPYLYTLFWEAATTGAPILRPLLYHYPNDPKTYLCHDQVFLGPSLMAAPVCRPGVEHRAVYLPEGTWYDWWTGDRLDGPTTILAAAPLERMPLYARGGAVIPLQPVMQYVGERPVEELTLRVFPGEGQWTLYEDDGHTFDYRTGAWATTGYQVHREGTDTVVEIAARQGQWQPSRRQIRVAVEGRSTQVFQDDGRARQFRM